LYPTIGALWIPAGVTPNATIRADLDNLHAAAVLAGLSARLPQQCNAGASPCAVPTP
jgi:hypothetical protein